MARSSVPPKQGGGTRAKGTKLLNGSSFSGRHRAPELGVKVFRSPEDYRVHLHIDRDNFMFWIEFHEDSDFRLVKEMTQTALLHRLVRDSDIDHDADPYDDEEDMGNGLIRIYLTTRDTLPDIPIPRSSMPDLSLTAYGPMSGEMPIVEPV